MSTVLGWSPDDPWDSTLSFKKGQSMCWRGTFWQAQRDIDGAAFSWLSKGEVPGESDAWKPLTSGVPNSTCGPANFQRVHGLEGERQPLKPWQTLLAVGAIGAVAYGLLVFGFGRSMSRR